MYGCKVSREKHRKIQQWGLYTHFEVINLFYVSLMCGAHSISCNYCHYYSSFIRGQISIVRMVITNLVACTYVHTWMLIIWYRFMFSWQAHKMELFNWSWQINSRPLGNNSHLTVLFVSVLFYTWEMKLRMSMNGFVLISLCWSSSFKLYWKCICHYELRYRYCTSLILNFKITKLFPICPYIIIIIIYNS